MDTLEQERQIIQKIISEYAQIPYAHGEIERHTVFDRDSDRYLLMIVGCEGVRHVHGCIIHVEIIDGKIWIHRDGTEDGIASELLKVGILTSCTWRLKPQLHKQNLPSQVTKPLIFG
jgi:hypothetical protein